MTGQTNIGTMRGMNWRDVLIGCAIGIAIPLLLLLVVYAMTVMLA